MLIELSSARGFSALFAEYPELFWLDVSEAEISNQFSRTFVQDRLPFTIGFFDWILHIVLRLAAEEGAKERNCRHGTESCGSDEWR